MLIISMLNVIKLTVVMLNVVKLNVIMLNVVAPNQSCKFSYDHYL
jgi:hypothetical protein